MEGTESRPDATQYPRKSITTLSLHEPNDRKNHVVEDSIVQQLRAALMNHSSTTKSVRVGSLSPTQNQEEHDVEKYKPYMVGSTCAPFAGIKPNMWKWIKKEEPRDDVFGLTFVL